MVVAALVFLDYLKGGSGNQIEYGAIVTALMAWNCLNSGGSYDCFGLA